MIGSRWASVLTSRFPELYVINLVPTTASQKKLGSRCYSTNHTPAIYTGHQLRLNGSNRGLIIKEIWLDYNTFKIRRLPENNS